MGGFIAHFGLPLNRVDSITGSKVPGKLLTSFKGLVNATVSKMYKIRFFKLIAIDWRRPSPSFNRLIVGQKKTSGIYGTYLFQLKHGPK